jgi:cytochrome c oxidase assembly factor CtaG
MSLKAFHLIFIVAAILLALGCAVWSWMSYFSPQRGSWDLVWALVSSLSVVGLIGYEVYFLKKLKNVSYL